MIWSFRFRNGVRGVTERHVEADSLAAADQLAQAWVNRMPGAAYIPGSCEAWLIVVEEVQPEAPVDVAGDGTPGKPGQKEQRQRLRAQATERLTGDGVGSAVKGEAARVGA